MWVFLKNDTIKDHPVGFETRRQNIFDPEEDDDDDSSDEWGDETHMSNNQAKERKLPNRAPVTDCAHQDCQKKARFDSIFCSDSCGVSALEGDLLRTFQYSSDIHPSALRN